MANIIVPRAVPNVPSPTRTEPAAGPTTSSSVTAPAPAQINTRFDGAKATGPVDLNGTPAMVANHHPRVEVPQTVMTLTSMNPEKWAAHVAIPLNAIKSDPLSTPQLAGEIASVTIPAPWANTSGPRPDIALVGPGAPGTTTIPAKIVGDGPDAQLVIDVPDVDPSAWKQIAPQLMVNLTTGDSLTLDVHAPKIGRDTSLLDLQNANQSVDAMQELVALDQQQIAKLQGQVDHPETIPPGVKLSQVQQGLAEYQGSLVADQTKLTQYQQERDALRSGPPNIVFADTGQG